MAKKPPSQRDRFIEAARELGASDDEATFKAKLTSIGKQKPIPAKLAQEPHPDAVASGLAPKQA